MAYRPQTPTHRCNDRMSEMFVTTAQLKGVLQQFRGILAGYLWCT